MILTRALTPSYLLEHGLKPDGHPDPNSESAGGTGSFDTFFTETC